MGVGYFGAAPAGAAGLEWPTTPLFEFNPANVEGLSDGDLVLSMADEQGYIDLALVDQENGWATWRDGVTTAGPNGKPFIRQLAGAASGQDYLTGKPASGDIFTDKNATIFVVMGGLAAGNSFIGACMSRDAAGLGSGTAAALMLLDYEAANASSFLLWNRLGSNRILTAGSQTWDAGWHVMAYRGTSARGAMGWLDNPAVAVLDEDWLNDLAFGHADLVRFTLGSADFSSPNTLGKGDVAYVVAFDSALSDEDVTTVMTTLKTEFDIS